MSFTFDIESSMLIMMAQIKKDKSERALNVFELANLDIRQVSLLVKYLTSYAKSLRLSRAKAIDVYAKIVDDQAQRRLAEASPQKELEEIKE